MQKKRVDAYNKAVKNERKTELHGVNEAIIINSSGKHYFLNENTRSIRGTIKWYPIISYVEPKRILRSVDPEQIV